jgi:hypothetical protein
MEFLARLLRPNNFFSPNTLSKNRNTENMRYPPDRGIMGDYEFKPLPDAGAMSYAYESLGLPEFTCIGAAIGAGQFKTVSAQTYFGMPGQWQQGVGLTTGTYTRVPLGTNYGAMIQGT